jgi:4-hydroxybenzoate polyprenyltransferase
MTEKSGLDAGAGGTAGMDARNAMVIVRDAQQRARRELRVRRPVLFLIWGLVVLVGYGAMWLSVRGQQPYHGPAWETLLLAFLLFLAAAGATANVVDWAAIEPRLRRP